MHIFLLPEEIEPQKEHLKRASIGIVSEAEKIFNNVPKEVSSCIPRCKVIQSNFSGFPSVSLQRSHVVTDLNSPVSLLLAQLFTMKLREALKNS